MMKSKKITKTKNLKTFLKIIQRAVIHTNYIAMDLMNQENGGRGGLIVNISSVSGVDCSQFSTPSYNATKHAVVAFTRSMGVS